MGSSHNRALYKCPITLTLTIFYKRWELRGLQTTSTWADRLYDHCASSPCLYVYRSHKPIATCSPQGQVARSSAAPSEPQLSTSPPLSTADRASDLSYSTYSYRRSASTAILLIHYSLLACVPDMIRGKCVSPNSRRNWPCHVQFKCHELLTSSVGLLTNITLMLGLPYAKNHVCVSNVSPCPCPGPWVSVLEYVLEFAIFNLRHTCLEVRRCTCLLYNFTAPTHVLDILHSSHISASRASISAQWPHSQASSCENKWPTSGDTDVPEVRLNVANFVSEMTDYVSSRTLNPTHSLTHWQNWTSGPYWVQNCEYAFTVLWR